MKRMEFGRRRSEGSNEKAKGMDRRGFFKVAGLLAGATALSFFGRDAKAVKPVTLKGVRVYKLTLSDSLSNLDKKSKPYASNGTAATVLKFPKEGLRATIGLVGTNKLLTLSHPKSATNPTRAYAGYKTDKFVNLVKKVTGKTPKKAKLIMEVAKDNGQKVINVYAIPLDSRGKVLGKTSKGQLAMGVSYYPGKRPGKSVWGAHALLNDPVKLNGSAVASAED